MKGIVFTMDAIFALVITVVGVSVLLFFQYYAQTPYNLHYSNAQTIFSNLASTTVASVQNSSFIAKALVNQYAGANETSPLFLGSAYAQGSNPIGPLYPTISYVFKPGNTITTSVVAAYGNIYFAANSMLYAVNATTNATVWSTNTRSNVASTPALASGMIFYANATNLTAANADNGNILWSTNSISSVTVSSPLLVYNNQVIFGGGDNWVHAYYATNGTAYWSNYTGSIPVSMAIAGGNLAVKTSTNNIFVIVFTGGGAKQVANNAYAIGNSPTGVAGSEGSTFYLGTGSSANATYTNGTVASGFPVGTGSTVTGAALYGNYIVYQTSAGVAALSSSGTSYWSVAVPSYFGSSITNATPAVSGSMVYTLWSNGLAGENLSTGTIYWFANTSGVTLRPRMTLAYGRLYVETSNKIVAYGACDSPPGSTLLGAVAAMYLNGQSGCGKALLNSIYPASNYTFFAGPPSTNTVLAADFNGTTAYVETGTRGFATISNSRTLVAWVNVSSYSNGGCGQEMATGYGPTIGGGVGQYSGLGLNANGLVSFAGNSDDYVSSLTAPKNTWTFIAAAYQKDTSNVTVYMNGQKATGLLSGNVLDTPTSGLASYIGAWPDGGCKFTGQIADVQVYASTLATSQVAQLYREGISGPPVSGAGLAGWWPLSGDTNDYGNYNTGFPVGGLGFVRTAYTSQALSNAYQISKASAFLPVVNYTTGASNTVAVGVYSWS